MLADEYLYAAAGGALIGLAAVLLLWFNGRIAGISGILNGAFTKDRAEISWRVMFLSGLVLGGILYQATTGMALIERTDFPVWMTVVAGLLVGYGTRLGSGCTSGHGICGIGRLSRRSIVATSVFVGVGMSVATLISKVA
ncbi:MAG: YeeE/YedE family protein, partial [Pseudomonadota bacterium]